MAKAISTVPIHVKRPHTFFWIYIGKSRYDLFMPKIPEKYTLPFKQLKLLKNEK